MMNLTLREIAEACNGRLVLQAVKCGETQKEGDTCVTSIVLDSRKVEQNGVFVATVGERVDGHKFVAGVYAQGAILAIVQKMPEQVETEHGIAPEQWGNYVLVEDTLQALKDIAEYYRRKLSVKIVGITGSVGKTSTKEFIAGVLSEKYQVLKTQGNFNNEIGVPLTLLRIRENHEVAVVEMGISDFGEMHRLSKMVRPDICVITNIGQCHLENLKSRDGILQAKSEIFDFMAENGEICLNGDDDKLSTLREVKGHKPHFFGLGKGLEGEDVSGMPKRQPLDMEVTTTDIVSHGLWGSDAVLVRNKENAMTTEKAEMGTKNMDGGSKGARKQLQVHVPLPGRHMVLNAAAAACVAGLFGLTDEEIAAGIAKIEPVSGRNHLMRLDRFTVIDDCYNANPASMKAALDLLSMADTEKVAILGDMFELGENASALHAEVGRYAAEAGVDRIICVGQESANMYEAARESILSKQMQADAECAEKKSMAQTTMHFVTRQDLLTALSCRADELVPAGCTVLVKASHGMVFTEVLDALQNIPSSTQNTCQG